MSSVNKAVIIGNIGKDPETRTFQDGNKVVSFSVAATERWKSKDGEKKEKTEWINISITNQGLADIALKYLKKGSKVYIEGSISTRKWQDKEGNDRYTTEVVLKPFRGELVLLDSKKDSQSSSDDDYDRTPEPAPARGRTATKDEMEDEIPFNRHLDFVGA